MVVTPLAQGKKHVILRVNVPAKLDTQEANVIFVKLTTIVQMMELA